MNIFRTSMVLILILAVSNTVESSEFRKHADKGLAHMHNHKFSDALIEFTKAKNLLRNTTHGVPPRLWFEMGRCHRGLKDNKKAIECFQKAIDAVGFSGANSSYNWRAKLMMALSLHDIGQTKKAKGMLERCERELKDYDLSKAVKDSRLQALLTTRKLIIDSAGSKK